MGCYFFIFPADVGDQYADHLVELVESRQCGAFIRQFLGSLGDGAFVSIVELLVGWVVGVFAAHLQLLFVAKVFAYIIGEKAGGGHDLIPPFALGACIHQIVDRSKQLPVFAVDQRIARFQILCQLVFHCHCTFLPQILISKCTPFKFTFIIIHSGSKSKGITR